MSTTSTAPRTPSLDELQEVLRLYDDVMRKLQASHERLESEVIRLREQLEQKNRELEMKKRLAALGEMAAGIAHEIRNPLGGIQLYASTLAAEVADRPLAAQLVQKISNGVKGLNSLVVDMLAFTRDLNMSLRPVDLAELVAVAVEATTATLLQHNVDVWIGEEIEGLVVRADPKLMERVLVNLLANAAEAVGGDGRREKGEGRREKAGNVDPHGMVEIHAVRDGDRITLTIDDNGPGIPADVIERIFNPFFTTKHTGTGLGLAIVHRIVEAHGGTIHAENRPQGGARFSIVFPQR